MKQRIILALSVLCLFTLMITVLSRAQEGFDNYTYLPMIAQPPPLYWASVYDVVDRNDYLESAIETVDGGFVAVGKTNAFGSFDDAWVLKLNKDGTIAWQKVFADTGDQYFSGVQETYDGNLILTGGAVLTTTNSSNLWVVKLDGSGNTIWQKTYGEFSQGFVQTTSDGGFLVTGIEFGPDARLLKLDSNGATVWQKTFGSSGSDYIVAVYETNDNGYILGGYTGSFGAGLADGWVLKLHENGAIAWQKTYGGAGIDLIQSMQVTDDQGVILVGQTDSFGAGVLDMWVLKLDNMGLLEWQKTYGGPSSDLGYSVQQVSDGGYVIAGITFSYGLPPSYPNDGDAWVLKLDGDGSVLWQKTYGGNEVDHGRSILETREGDFILVGYTRSFGSDANGWVLKLDPLGNINNCGIIGTSQAVVGNTPLVIQDSTVTVEMSMPVVADTYIVSQEMQAEVTSACDTPP